MAELNNWCLGISRNFRHGVLYDVDLLFLVEVFQPFSTYHIHSIQKEANLKLPKKIDVLAIAHSQVWLHVVLLAFEPFFVFFAHSLTPVPPLFDLQWIIVMFPLYEYKNLSSISSARHYLSELKQIDCIRTILEIDFWLNLRLNSKLLKYMVLKDTNNRKCSLQNLKISGSIYLLLDNLDRSWTENFSIELLDCCYCKKLYMILKNTSSRKCSFVQNPKSPKLFIYCFEILTERCIGIRAYFTEPTERCILKTMPILQK